MYLIMPKNTISNKSLRFIKRDSSEAIRFSLVDSKQPDTAVSYLEFLTHLKEDQSFRTQLSTTINQEKLDGFYWECIPVSSATLSATAFEFVLIPTSFHATANPSDFLDKFSQLGNQSKKIINFKNKNRDADLVVPTPPEKNVGQQHYLHLASFLREATKEQQDQLWHDVAATLEHCLKEAEDQPIWMSTHGKGADWLHIRLDKKPKYYHFKEFKEFKLPNINTPKINDRIISDRNTSSQGLFIGLFRYPKVDASIGFLVCIIVTAALLANGVTLVPAATIALLSGAAVGACVHRFFAPSRPESTVNNGQRLINSFG